MIARRTCVGEDEDDEKPATSRLAPPNVVRLRDDSNAPAAPRGVSRPRGLTAAEAAAVDARLAREAIFDKGVTERIQFT